MKVDQVLIRICSLIAIVITLAVVSARESADTGTCGGQTVTLPFTDVAAASPFFCSIAEAFSSGLTNGTTPTTYSPSNNVPREQMAAFTTRVLDQSLRRGDRRAQLDQWWTPQGLFDMQLTSVGTFPNLVESDGADLWVANGTGGGTVSRVRASDGKLLETWTGATFATGVLVAAGKIFVTGNTNPSGSLYQIDPTMPAGAVTTLTASLALFPDEMAFDGSRIWIAHDNGTVSIVTLNPLAVINVPTGVTNGGILFDGANIWVADPVDGKIRKLDSNGAVLTSVNVGGGPHFIAFDGANIWAPKINDSTLNVVRVKDSQGDPLASPVILATLSGNGLVNPLAAAFDGERILVTNRSADSLSLWKATDLTPLGTFSTGSSSLPFGVCSDGQNFWITLQGFNKLARF